MKTIRRIGRTSRQAMRCGVGPAALHGLALPGPISHGTARPGRALFCRDLHRSCQARSTAMVLLLCAATLALAWPVGEASAQRRQRDSTIIGLAVDGPSRDNQPIFQVFKREIDALTEGEFGIQIPVDKQIVGNWTAKSVKAAVDKLLADPDVDIIVGMGILASNELGRRKKLSKPVIAPFIVDPQLQRIPVTRRGTSGRKNLAYLALPQTFERDLAKFRELLPFKTLTVLIHSQFAGAVPGLGKRLARQTRRLGVKLHIVRVGRSASRALAAIPDDTEAVYLRSMLQLREEERNALAAGLIKRKLPSFSFVGRTEVERGILAGTRPASDFTLSARRTALIVQQILLGESLDKLPVTLEFNERLVINMATARAIGYSPNWKIITEAVLLNSKRSNVERTESLATVVRAAVANNIDLAAAKEVVVAGKNRVREARAYLLPSVELASTARLIDEDTATASLGLQPERQWTGTASATQVIIAEPAWARLSAEKKLQDSRQSNLERARLDVIANVAVAYLDVLRAKALERIQRQNLDTTRSNLARARSRVNIGAGTRAEVYRFELQIANDRKSVIAAVATRNIAEIALNRILNRPLEEPFDTEDATISDPVLLTRHKKLFSYMQNPAVFTMFRQFMAEQTLSLAPELKSIDSLVAAQKRLVTSRRLSYFVPTVAVKGGVTGEFYRGGAGQELDLGSEGPLPAPFDMLPERPDINWFVGVTASFRLFEGGASYARSAREQAELRRLERERQALRGRLTQLTLSRMHNLGSTYAAIDLSQEGATAARKNLELVTDSYSQGATTVVELIDAQNSALIAEQVAANAIYDFLVQWMNVQRAVGQFDVLMKDTERDDFFRQADWYISNARRK
ncbi:MAG: TolC family protein [Proteobacteria bacterium]|nr:TolC family protein [Pseudomonadota bacterium]